MAALVRIFIILAALTPLLAPPAHAIPLGSPETVIVIHEPGGAQLFWLPAVGASFYTLYRGSTPTTLMVIATLEGTTYFDPATPSIGAYYAVAVNNAHPGFITAVGGEGCVSVDTNPPAASTHTDSCIGA